MKKNLFLLLFYLLTCQLAATAQEQPLTKLALSSRMTTSLLFPYPIQSIDRGSGDVLAQIPGQARNVLQVKAARPGFPETNLTVISTDGRLYSFRVFFDDHPISTLVQVDRYAAASILFPGAGLNEAQLQHITRQLEEDKRFHFGVRDSSGGVKAVLEGIYIQGTTLFYRVVLTNRSPIPYTIDFSRVTLRDRRQARRTATQEEEIDPLYVHGQPDTPVEARGRRVLVFAVEKRTFGSSKELLLNLFEQNGGRHLRLRIRDKDLLLACPLLFEAPVL